MASWIPVHQAARRHDQELHLLHRQPAGQKTMTDAATAFAETCVRALELMSSASNVDLRLAFQLSVK